MSDQMDSLGTRTGDENQSCSVEKNAGKNRKQRRKGRQEGSGAGTMRLWVQQLARNFNSTGKSKLPIEKITH